MPAPAITLRQLRELDPCKERMAALEDKLPAKGPITAAQAVEAGANISDLEWLVERLAKEDDDVARRARLYAADCAARVLPIFEAQNPGDDRPQQAIITARAYALGEVDLAALYAAMDLAFNAAKDAAPAPAIAWGDARAAARDAASAAARAAAGGPTGAVARVALLAAAGTAAGDATWAGEREWQFVRLLQWLSDDEPDPLPLDPVTEAA